VSGRSAAPRSRLPPSALHALRLPWNPREVEPAICELVVEYPARPVFRCALVRLHARLGRLAEAKRPFDDLARDEFSALPFDQEWLYGMTLLAETSAVLGDTDSAVVVYRLLLPWATLNTVDVGEGIRGSVSRYLGILATTTRHWEAAELHGRMLLTRDRRDDRERARDLLDQATAIYRELGMETHAARASAPARAGVRA
jgi:hypothetical protein